MFKRWIKRILGRDDPPKRYSLDTTVPKSSKESPVKVTWPKR